jgi:hypothetical protein
MATFAQAWEIVRREFEIFAYGEAHTLDVLRNCPTRQDRWDLFRRLSDNVLTALRRELPHVSDRQLTIFRDDVVMGPLIEKVDRVF